MIKEISYQDKKFKVDVRDSTEPVQRDWGNGAFSNRAILNFIKDNHTRVGSFVEVGAGLGNNTMFFNGVLGRTVHAFEPDEALHGRLSKHIINNELNARVIKYAISDFSGYALKTEKGINYIRSKKDLFNMSVTTLDLIVFDNVSLLYIDVNANDESILKGAKRIIKSCKPDIYVRTENPNRLALFLSEIYKVPYEVKYTFNDKKIYYLKPVL